MQNWPATLVEFWSWHMEAACGAVDISLFYSPEGERGPRKARRERAAKQICARCKVADVCAAFAVATREPYGTWGGSPRATAGSCGAASTSAPRSSATGRRWPTGSGRGPGRHSAGERSRTGFSLEALRRKPSCASFLSRRCV